jgi:hypothetical protein
VRDVSKAPVRKTNVSLKKGHCANSNVNVVLVSVLTIHVQVCNVPKGRHAVKVSATVSRLPRKNRTNNPVKVETQTAVPPMARPMAVRQTNRQATDLPLKKWWMWHCLPVVVTAA